MQLQLQYCSCNYTSILVNQFRMSNYLCVPSLVIMNALHPKSFNMLFFLAICLKKYCSCSCCTAAAAAVLQLQQQNLSESNQNIKLLICAWISENKWKYIKYYSNCSCSCSCSAAAARLQLQQQYPFESIQNVKQPLSMKFGDNKCTISQIIQFIAFTSLIFTKSAAAAAAAAAIQDFSKPWSWSLY